jgi:hypothetical protein
MLSAIYIVGAVVLGLLFMSVVAKITLDRVSKVMKERVAKHCQGAEIVKVDYTAMSFGQESKGKFQGRGNGALILTTKEIIFLRAVMPTELTVPLERVTRFSFVHSHLGKATPYRLLKIEFDGDAGGEDSIALIVKDPDGFMDAIETACAKAA